MVTTTDVARLFGYETKQLNRQVFRNIERFPEDYCFRLTEIEFDFLRCQSVTLKIGRGHHRKYLPYVFTEHGITMLAGVLKSDVAVKMSLKIVNAFISMRKMINENKDIFKRLTTVEYKMLENDENFYKIFNALEPKKIQNQKIFFYGEIYDSYSLIIDLISKANNRLIIIDNYVDKSILDMLTYKKENVSIKIITNYYSLTKLDINKFNEQYPNLETNVSNIFHDRFIIADDILYHLGASLKDLGFCISIIKDKEYLNKIIEKIS